MRKIKHKKGYFPIVEEKTKWMYEGTTIKPYYIEDSDDGQFIVEIDTGERIPVLYPFNVEERVDNGIWIEFD